MLSIQWPSVSRKRDVHRARGALIGTARAVDVLEELGVDAEVLGEPLAIALLRPIHFAIEERGTEIVELASASLPRERPAPLSSVLLVGTPCGKSSKPPCVKGGGGGESRARSLTPSRRAREQRPITYVEAAFTR